MTVGHCCVAHGFSLALLKLLVEVFNIVGPSLLIFMNSCLSCGLAAAALKHAVARLLLKKPQLVPSVLLSFRPVLYLLFMSKVLEKVFLIPLQSFLENNSIFEKFQSGVRSHHRTESALVKGPQRNCIVH